MSPEAAARATAPDYEIRAFANCDHAFLVWKPAQPIPGCRGFAVYRKQAEADAATRKVLDTWLGFAGETYPPGTHNPSTEWPVQRLVWSDFQVDPGPPVQYSVAPVLRDANGQLTEYPELASGWSEPVSLSPQASDVTAAYFNRGILAAQWVAERLKALGGDPGADLAAAIHAPGDQLRELLAGVLGVGLRQMLQDAQTDGSQVYAALFELDAQDLIDLLIGFGQRAHLILCNGSPDLRTGQTDENAAVRTSLEHGGAPLLDLHDRMLDTREHLGHNKFLVVCDAQGAPQKVWAGSTNWTDTGLCTQVNNGLLISDPTLAGLFKAHWDQLKAAGNTFPPELAPNNPGTDPAALSTSYTANGAPARMTVFFAPTVPGSQNGPLESYPDLKFVKGLVEQAKQGILFLMFMPGVRDTLLDVIQQVGTHNPDLFVRGALNEDPGASSRPGAGDDPYVALFHRGVWQRTSMDAVLPAAIPVDAGPWLAEIKKLPQAHAMVHSKVIVIDPLGAHPVVVTGSHNLGPKASRANCDNLVVVEGDAALARAYAVNVQGVYDKYSWRFHSERADQFLRSSADPTDPQAPTIEAPPWAPQMTRAAGAGAPHRPAPPGAPVGAEPMHFIGLEDDDTWQDRYFGNGVDVPEIRFWLAGA